jgi:DNA-binding NarL/FixJ family response regulator
MSGSKRIIIIIENHYRIYGTRQLLNNCIFDTNAVVIKLYIYEDDEDLREGLSKYLSSTGDFEVVCSFGNCDTIGIDLKNTKVDVVLMDIDMPGINGIEGVRLAKAVQPDISILMFTVFDDDKKIFDAICAGADGYLLKKTPPDKIIEALKDVSSGGAPITPSIAKKVLQSFQKKNSDNDNELLTVKEREILLHLVNGKSYKQIAVACLISIETVRTHIKRIYAKLHVHSMSQAVAKAIQQKIV